MSSRSLWHGPMTLMGSLQLLVFRLKYLKEINLWTLKICMEVVLWRPLLSGYYVTPFSDYTFVYTLHEECHWTVHCMHDTMFRHAVILHPHFQAQPRQPVQLGC